MKKNRITTSVKKNTTWTRKELGTKIIELLITSRKQKKLVINLLSSFQLDL